MYTKENLKILEEHLQFKIQENDKKINTLIGSLSPEEKEMVLNKLKN
ncbi:hypothetical protein [Polaribacter aquimarinus]|nr:hypothetical protein [Polaribacter aquimarinus]